MSVGSGNDTRLHEAATVLEPSPRRPAFLQAMSTARTDHAPIGAGHGPGGRSGAVLATDGTPAAPAGDDRVQRRMLGGLGAAIGQRLTDVAAERMARHMRGSTVTPFDTPLTADETLSCCEAHVHQVTSLIARDASPEELSLPLTAIDHARSYVHRRLPLDELLRAYRRGHRSLAETLAAAARANVDDRARLVDVLADQASFLFEYFDRASDLVGEVYRDEQVRWSSSAVALRTEMVDELLRGQTVDPDAAEWCLGRSLSGVHLAFIVTTDVREDGRLEHAAGLVADALGLHAPVHVPTSATEAWAWCTAPAGSTIDTTVLPSIADHWGGLTLAFGRPHEGAVGFRVSHEEAQIAARFAAGSAGAGPSVSYDDVEFLSLLAEDHTRAERFVRRMLGPLASPDPRSQRLRRTVLAYLRSDKSRKAAAEVLDMHPNGVGLRIARAEKILGARSTTWGMELQAALALADILGLAVPPDDHGPGPAGGSRSPGRR